MRLLDTSTGHFVEEDQEYTKYAILSHTWDEAGEQTYKELRKIQKRYDLEPHRGSSMINLSASHPLDNLSIPSISLMTTISLTATGANESTPLLAPQQLSFLEQGISQSGVAHPESSFTSSTLHSNSRSQAQVHFGGVSPSDPPELNLSRSIWDDSELSPKIRRACEVARADGYKYIWIDSCCIDKSSSSELSEAINSMYAWYGRAHVCYAYLADVPTGDNHRGRASWFRESRWFKRGWTLQELIAPLHLVFLSQDWTIIGAKHALYDLVQEVTSISEEVLLHLSLLDKFSVAERLSWAASRFTTREEDRAYSLLGIFDINMPILYGEGSRAFRRLQEEIMQRIPDQSLFMWGDVYLGPPVLGTTTAQHKGIKFGCYPHLPRSLFATTPSDFRNSQVRTAASVDVASSIQLEYTPCPYGVRTRFHMIPLSLIFPADSITCFMQEMDLSQWYLVILGCQLVSGGPGHLLGRVCYTISSDFGVDFLFPGFLSSNSSHPSHRSSDIFIIPPNFIQQYRPETVLKVVYISHPAQYGPQSLHHLLAFISDQPRPESIRLLLLAATQNGLRAGGYVVDFRGPDKTGDSTIHLLMLSHDVDAHTVTIEFRHVFDSDGEELTINARGTVSPCTFIDSAHDIPRVAHATMSWTHGVTGDFGTPRPDHEGPLVLDTGFSRLTMNLGLEFVFVGVYRLRIDILRGVSQAVSSPLPIELFREEDGDAPRPVVDGDVPRLGGADEERSAESTAGDGGPAEVGVEAEAVALGAEGAIREAEPRALEGGNAGVECRPARRRFAFWRSRNPRQAYGLHAGEGGGEEGDGESTAN